MKNYFLTGALAVLVVLTGVSLKQSVAGIGGSPVPPSPPKLMAIGGSPVPPSPPKYLAIGGSPVPPSPPKSVDAVAR
jgi:hypothetical protein